MIYRFTYTTMKGFIVYLSPWAIKYCVFLNAVNKNRKVFGLWQGQVSVGKALRDVSFEFKFLFL